MRGVSSRMAASPRRTSSSESNFWSMRLHERGGVGWILDERAGGVAMAGAQARTDGQSAGAVALARRRRRRAASWSVTLAMALTTTTGCLPMATRPATMAAVRSMAAGSSTEVPPNFITTRLMPNLPIVLALAAERRLGARGSRGRSHWFKFAQAGQQLGVEDGGSGGAANGVVREHSELPIEQAAGAQAADGDGHAAAAIAVEAGLRAVGLRGPLHRLLGSDGQMLPASG